MTCQGVIRVKAPSLPGPCVTRRHERAAACARSAALQPAAARAACRARQSRHLPRRCCAHTGGAAHCPCGAAAAASRRGCVRRSRTRASASAADASAPATRAAAERGGVARPGSGARLARRRYGALEPPARAAAAVAPRVAHSLFAFGAAAAASAAPAATPADDPLLVRLSPPAAQRFALCAAQKRPHQPRINPAPHLLLASPHLPALHAAATSALHRGRAARARAA